MPLNAATIRRSQISIKTLLTVAAVSIAVFGALYVVIHAGVSLGLTIAGILIAVALDHLVQWMEKRGLARKWAVGVVMLGLLLIIAGIFFAILPPAVVQVQHFTTTAPDLLARVQHSRPYEWLNQRTDIEDRLQSLNERAPELLTTIAAGVVKAVAAAFTATISVFFMVIFMLVFGGSIVRGLLDEAIPQRRLLYERVLAKMYRSIGGYLNGLFFICALNITGTSIVLALLKIPFFLPLGILSGVGSIFPMVGAIVAGVLIALVGLITGGMWKAAAVVAWYIGYQLFENHVISPVVYRRTVQVNPLVVLLALLFFSELWGMPGAIIAVPAVAMGQILLRELLAWRRALLDLPPSGPASVRPPISDEALANSKP